MLLVAFAGLLAWVLAAVIVDGAGLARVSPALAGLLLVAVARAALGWLSTTLPQRAAAAVKLELRRELVETAVSGSPSVPTGEAAAIAGPGLDALDPYFARYVPELVRAATIPLAVLVALFTQDLTTALIVVLTLPLIPLFGALVGRYTERRTRRQWRVLAVLSHHFLDVVRGLPTLKAFGRAKAQADTVARVTEQHRLATMATLRVALLSALVLELLATISVALVAVSVGLRLVHGGLDLETGLFLLILAPEAYLPLRRSAAEYHAASEGMAAAERAFAVIDGARLPARHSPGEPAPGRGTLELDRVTVAFPDRETPALDRLSLVIPPGSVTAVVGPSGSGKSTLLRVLLGLCAPDGGTVRVGGVDLSTVDLARWHRQVAWLPQHPNLVAGTVTDNIRLGRPDASDRDVRAAAGRAGAAGFIEDLPSGYGSLLGEGGIGLSAGQRQRLALARVLLRDDAWLVLLDEPTAHLDAETEGAVRAAVRDLSAGRTVVIVTHRPALLDAAHRIVDLTPVGVP